MTGPISSSWLMALACPLFMVPLMWANNVHFSSEKQRLLAHALSTLTAVAVAWWMWSAMPVPFDSYSFPFIMDIVNNGLPKFLVQA